MSEQQKDTLFLLTKTYPYGPGEQYITGELQALSLQFKKVILYPNDYYGKTETHDKKLPANVEILNFNQVLYTKQANNVSDYGYLFRNAWYEFWHSDDKKHVLKYFKWNLLNFWTQLKLARHFEAYLKEQNVDIAKAVFYSYWFHKSAIFLGILKSRGAIRGFVSRAHSIDLYHQYWGVINNESRVPSFKMFKYRYIDRIITISEHGSEFIKSHYPKYADKATRYYLGVASPGLSRQQETRAEFLIVTCSHLDYTKRVDMLANALARAEMPCRWVHFGGGPEREWKKIEDALRHKPDHVQVEIKGYVPNDEIHAFFQSHHVNLFVNLSMVEGVPVSIMEALSYGVPVLATAIYGTPEAVIEQESGFLLSPSFTVEELSEKLHNCMKNRDQLELMRPRAYDVYNRKFRADKNYSEFANFLATL